MALPTMQHRLPYPHTSVKIKLLSTISYLVGAELERDSIETKNLQISDRPETQKLLDRAKSVLQRAFQLYDEEAYRHMRLESRQHRKAMREVSTGKPCGKSLRRSSD